MTEQHYMEQENADGYTPEDDMRAQARSIEDWPKPLPDHCVICRKWRSCPDYPLPSVCEHYIRTDDA